MSAPTFYGEVERLLRAAVDAGPRALVAAKIANLPNGQRAPSSGEEGAVTQLDAAKLLDVSACSVQRGRAAPAIALKG